MADVIYVGVICAFFALCVVYIRWCDRIIGSDDLTMPSSDGTVGAADIDVSAPSPVGSPAGSAVTV
ncbi:MAG: potassium transporter Trk [Ilumatobacteraceae bacterium]